MKEVKAEKNNIVIKTIESDEAEGSSNSNFNGLAATLATDVVANLVTAVAADPPTVLGEDIEIEFGSVTPQAAVIAGAEQSDAELASTSVLGSLSFNLGSGLTPEELTAVADSDAFRSSLQKAVSGAVGAVAHPESDTDPEVIITSVSMLPSGELEVRYEVVCHGTDTAAQNATILNSVVQMGADASGSLQDQASNQEQ